MLLPAAILALSSASTSSDIRTLSSNDYTEEVHESPRPQSHFDRRFTLELRLGVAAPTGGLGGALEFALVPRVGVGCGVGTNGVGPEYACWLRARPIIVHNRALTLSSGLSTAPFVQSYATVGGAFGWATAAMAQMGEHPPPPDRAWAHADWLNSDVGYESRRNSFLFRVFGGLAALLNPNDSVIQSTDSDDAPAADKPVHVLIYAGIGLGYYGQ
ncbi:MAG TPA: hypothetical protein VHM25_11895 [Polyangiaceae bacterium]|jgi:hypothetical protein|nr:hypothetical protein [Polyangiaceae bacterium]